MNKATRQLREAVMDYSFAQVNGKTYRVPVRTICAQVGLPESKGAVINRIQRDQEGVSLAEENYLRPFFHLDPLPNTTREYDTRTHKVIAKYSNKDRPARRSTDFSPEVYERFQLLRDRLGLTNDSMMNHLIDQHYALDVSSHNQKSPSGFGPLFD